MNEPAVPNERPSYWNRCERMEFRELREFIEDSLNGLFSPDPTADRPGSEEEFWVLLDMLRGKAGMSKASAEPLLYKPSATLVALRARRERTLAFLREASNDPSATKKDIFKAERSLKAQERDIVQREARERQDRTNRQDSWTLYDTRHRVVQRIRRAIERAFKPSPTGAVEWEPFRPGEGNRDGGVRGYYEGLQRQGKIDDMDEERLNKATQLPYVDWWVPKSKLHAYSIFTFAHTTKVLLESPAYGNAAYIINAREEDWVGMTKQEFIDSGMATKVAHQGENWDKKIRRALDLEQHNS